MLSIDLHTHSEASFDGRDSVDLILQQADAVGLDAVAITDHDEIRASREAVERAASIARNLASRAGKNDPRGNFAVMSIYYLRSFAIY